MKPRRPISKKNLPLPFQDPSFGYGDFEGFFADFLRLHPVIEISRDGAMLKGRVTNAWRYETSGDVQNGIDIRAEVQVTQPDGSSQQETWAFQCKHRARWSDQQTKDAIKLANERFPAGFHFLLVTCDLSSKTVDEGRSHPGWHVWSREEITARVRALPNSDEAARVLATYFGSHWAEVILGLSGSGPLQASGAFFARQMEAGSLFHHKADIVGRREELKALHEFLKDHQKQLLILPGAGGGGKSRLLKAFSQSLSPSQRREWSIRFFDDIGLAVTEADLRALEGTPVIIVDDAHRRDLEPLLRVVLRTNKAKMILATRPQGMALVRETASATGVDARRIHEMPPLKRLAQKEIKGLAESLLGKEFHALASDVVAQARGCLLIVVVACELIRQKRLTKTHLASNKDFEQAVFLRLIGETIARLGLITEREHIDRILDHLSLAGPIPRQGPWFDLLVQATGKDAKPSEVRIWLEELKRSGLLTENREGYRVTPDLLSDYLLYRKTFDDSHRDLGFAADYLASVPEDLRNEALARCLPNLAEAEWRARCESDGQQQSVVEPLLNSWIAQFRSASFHRRREMLGQWSRFGVYLPEQTLRIAQLALELTTSDTPNEEAFLGTSRDDYESVVDAITPLLKEVARYHPDHMHACFDMLWSIGSDQPKRWMHSNQHHPLSAIIEVSQLEYRKSLSVNENALAWVENQFTKPEVIERLRTPEWWFKALLSPFLKHSVEDNQYDEGAGIFSISHIPVDAARVMSLRERVLNLVSGLAARGDEGLVINALSVLGHAFKMSDLPGLKEDHRLQREWIPQRRDALGRIAGIARRYQSGFIHWAIWHELWWNICYEPVKLLRAEIWLLFDLLSDTFELRLVRATCSTGESEITPSHRREAVLNKEERSWQKSRELWSTLCAHAAVELAERYPDARQLHNFLADFVQRGAALGSRPGLGTVLLPLAQRSHHLADALAREIIASPRTETKHAFGSLVDGLSPAGKSERLDLVEAAARYSNLTLQEEAARILLWWLRDKRLPDEGRTLLLELVQNGPSQVVRSSLLNASLLPADADPFIDELIESALANPTADDITEPLLAALDRVERNSAGHLATDLVSSALARLVSVPMIHDAMEQYHLSHLIESHPLEVFEFYRQRIQFSRELPRQAPFNGNTYEALPGYGDHVSLATFAKHPAFPVEFAKLRNEMIQILQSRVNAGDGRHAFEYGDHYWKLRQLARWMLTDAGSIYADLVGDWTPMIDSVDDLDLFIEVVVDRSPSLVLGHPHLLQRLLTLIETKLPEQNVAAQKALRFSASRWVGASRNPQWRRVGDSTPFEDEEPWQIIPTVEKLIQDHAHHPRLATFYRQLLTECQSMLEGHRHANRRMLDDDDEGF